MCLVGAFTPKVMLVICSYSIPFECNKFPGLLFFFFFLFFLFSLSFIRSFFHLMFFCFLFSSSFLTFLCFSFFNLFFILNLFVIFLFVYFFIFICLFFLFIYLLSNDLNLSIFSSLAFLLSFFLCVCGLYSLYILILYFILIPRITLTNVPSRPHSPFKGRKRDLAGPTPLLGFLRSAPPKPPFLSFPALSCPCLTKLHLCSCL